MPELTLKTVTIRNWARMASVSLSFPESGLVVVVGTNKASGGRLASVGSGKTALGEAIFYALFGNTGRFSNIRECSREPGGDTYVSIETALAGKPLIVESGYKCVELNRTGEGLRYTYDGKTYERDHITNTRADLAALTGITPVLAPWTVFLDGDALRFSKLDHAAKTRLLMEALRQMPWDVHHKQALATARDLRQALDHELGVKEAAERSVQSATAALEVAELALANARESQAGVLGQIDEALAHDSEAHAQLTDRISATDAQIATLRSTIEDMVAESADANKKAEIAVSDARTALRQLEQKRPASEAAVRRCERAMAVADQAYTALQNTTTVCPTCQQPWHKKPGKEAVATARKNKQKADTDATTAQATLTALDADIAASRAAVDAAEAALLKVGARVRISGLSAELAGLERTVSRLLREAGTVADAIAKKRAERVTAESAITAAENRLVEKQEILNEARQQLAVAVSSADEADQALRSVEFWTHAFSPAGIPNRVLREAITPLNHEAERVSAALTGNTINVQFSVERTTTQGVTKPELAIQIKNRLGASKLAMNSKGENSLSNLIIAETLGAVGRLGTRVGFRWYDEVVPNQDATVARNVYARLRDLAAQLGILIFLVDHSPVAEGYADYVLRVTKSGKEADCVSTVEWA